MSVHQIDTDYLVVGSGAVGMAFADTLLSETEANITIVDLHHKPGGHWNVAYPFVTLHQPSAFYGVNSRELSNGRLDEVGLNKGLGHLASGDEVMAYFDAVMRQTFLPSGRVQYFPMCKYAGDGNFHPVTTGKEYHVNVSKKYVDATYLKTTVPATHTPNFSIDPALRFVPLNELPSIKEPPAGYVVIGGGKTGIDACLWLLENGVDPDKIEWIVSRDAWLTDRRNTQPTPEFFKDSMGAQAAQMEAAANATSIEDLFDRLEAAGVLLRIDKNVRPTMFHGATISKLELEELRRIKNVIRLGRVQQLEKDEIILDEGTIPTNPDKLFVDCSASAISNIEMKPIFSGDTITPQTVRSYQPVFSGAFIAHVEAAYETDEEKNNICNVVPLPNHDTDWIRFTVAFMRNQYVWSQDKSLKQWLFDNRLDGFTKLMWTANKNDPDNQAIMKRMRENAMPAAANLQKLMADI